MTLRWLLGATLLAAVLAIRPAGGEPSPAAGETPALPTPGKLAPFEERLKTAETVKVLTNILGVRLQAPLKEAHKKLDSLCGPGHPPKEEVEEAGEEGESGHKVLWELAKSDFASVFVKADEKEQIVYILANLRPGKEIPFSKIGQVANAPVHTASTIAWDVVRRNSPLIRVVAQGAEEKASSLTLFVAKREPKARPGKR